MTRLAAIFGAVLAACAVPVTPSPAEHASISGFVRSAGTHPVLVGAGDIASCSSSGDEATAALLDAIPGTVFTTGDNAYPGGTRADFRCYDASWGRHRARTRPTPGNHDYRTPGASAYFRYFGAAAGPSGRGYYSYDLGTWHVVALDSNCTDTGGCGPGSPQEQWLRADLAAHPARCTVAYWHHPPFTSGDHDPAVQTRPLLRALSDHGAEVVITGHNHNYERFAPQTADGRRDDVRGVRAFVVGTGGRSLYGFDRDAPHSEARDDDTYGVLALVLRPDGYDWRFVPTAGGTFTDSGSGRCH